MKVSEVIVLALGAEVALASPLPIETKLTAVAKPSDVHETAPAPVEETGHDDLPSPEDIVNAPKTQESTANSKGNLVEPFLNFLETKNKATAVIIPDGEKTRALFDVRSADRNHYDARAPDVAGRGHYDIRSAKDVLGHGYLNTRSADVAGRGHYDIRSPDIAGRGHYDIRDVAGRGHYDIRDVAGRGHYDIRDVAGRGHYDIRDVAGRGHYDIRDVAGRGHYDIRDVAGRGHYDI